ncbi:MAG: DUF2281 domain-containing protein [Bacteroidia bacterium]
MSHQQIIKLFDALPENYQLEVMHFIEFLMQKSQVKHVKEIDQTERKKRHFGHAKGKIYMSPDFDQPLEDFKDYM